MVAAERTAGMPSSPRLEYRLAFDLAFARLAEERRVEHPILLVASASVFVQETLARAAAPVTVLAESARMADIGRSPAGPDALWPQTRVEVLGPDSDPPSATGGYKGAIWASPQPLTWRRCLGALDGALTDGALLALLVAGTGAPLLASLRTGWAPGEPAWTAAKLQRKLEHLGYRTKRVYYLGGPRGVVWAAMSRVAGVIGRPDLADRYEAGYRLALADVGSRLLAQFRLVVVAKGMHG